MKKITKLCVAISIITAVVGTIALFAGMTMGARPEDFLQINIGSRGITVEGAPWLQISGNVENTDGEMREETIPAGQIDSIKMKITGGEVNIRLTDNSETITCYSNRNQKLCSVEYNTLTIQDDGLWEDLQLELYLPEKIWKKVALELGAGSAHIENLQAEKASVTLGAGEVTLDFLFCTDRVDFKVGTGELTAAFCDVKNLKLDCGIGSMAVVLAGGESDYDYRLQCGLGIIRLPDQEFTGTRWENKVNTGTEKKVEANCGIGEIVIDFAETE